MSSFAAAEVIRSRLILSTTLPAQTETRRKHPRLYSQEDIARMARVVPSELTPTDMVQTPAGRWSIEEGITIFEYRGPDTLRRITKPPIRERLSRIAKVVFQMP